MTTFHSRYERPTSLQVLVLVLFCLVSRCGFAGWFSGTASADLGAVDGRLKPCPDTPNCVNSQARGPRHVAALAFSGAPEAAIQRLRRVLEAMPRTRVVAESTHYLRAEAASRLLGFVDDVEFVVDPGAHLVHVRSAARIGYSDFGVNRRRIEAIRAAVETSHALR